MIKITCLVENTAKSPDIKSKHGLSLYVQTCNRKILFDVGPNDLFLKNAAKLGVDVASVDAVVISHGHVDHCGGLRCFFEANKTAKAYVRPQAVQAHFVKVLGVPFYAGMDRSLPRERFVFTDDLFRLDEQITLFSDVFGQFPLPKSDGNLLMKSGGKLVADDFCHEQNLIVHRGESSVLFCGCAHAGIANIMDKAKSVIGRYPTAVVGGFHLFEPTKKRYESAEYIDQVAAFLERTDSIFYTCHCTGEIAYLQMKKRLGDRLSYLCAGSEICL